MSTDPTATGGRKYSFTRNVKSSKRGNKLVLYP